VLEGEKEKVGWRKISLPQISLADNVKNALLFSILLKQNSEEVDEGAIDFEPLLALFRRRLAESREASRDRTMRGLADRGLRLVDLTNVHRSHGPAVPDADGADDDGLVTFEPDLKVWDEGWED